MSENEETENKAFQSSFSPMNNLHLPPSSQQLLRSLKSDEEIAEQTLNAIQQSPSASLQSSSLASSLKYCYELDSTNSGSAVCTPIQTPTAVATMNSSNASDTRHRMIQSTIQSMIQSDHERHSHKEGLVSSSSGGYLNISKEAPMTPSSTSFYNTQHRPITPVPRLHSEITEQVSNLNTSPTKKGYFHDYNAGTADDKASITSSSIFGSSSFGDEELFLYHGSISNHGDSIESSGNGVGAGGDGGGNTTVLNSTLNTSIEMDDHGDSFKQYLEEPAVPPAPLGPPTTLSAPYAEEEKEEIRKHEEVFQPYHPNLLGTGTNFLQNQESMNYHQADDKALYIQDLYRKVIAANTSDFNLEKQQDNNDNLIDMMREPAIHKHKYNEIVSNQVFGYRHKNSNGNNGRGHKYGRDDHPTGYIPNWVVNSSPMLKFVIIISTSLLIGSMALILIAVSVSVNSKAGGASQQTTNFHEFTNVPTPSVIWTNVIPSTSDSPSLYHSTEPSNGTDEPAEVPEIPVVGKGTSPSSSPAAKMSEIPSHQSSTLNKNTPIPSIIMTSKPSISFSAEPSKSYQTSSPSISPQPSKLPTDHVVPKPTSLLSSIPSTIKSNLPSRIVQFSPSLAPSTQEESDTDGRSNPKFSNPPSNFSPSIAPSITKSIAKFYITSRNKEKSIVSNLLPNLPGDENEWMIHLGNWNDHSNETNRCRSGFYDRVSDLYKNSSVPVFFLPGDNEWNDCDDFPLSVTRWRNTFVDYEKNWGSLNFQVSRHRNRPENFCFVYKKAIYIGLNMIGGRVPSRDQWKKRLKDNFNWVRLRVEENIDNIDVVLIFGNSGNIESNAGFFVQLKGLVQKWNSEMIQMQVSNTESQVRRHLPVFYIKQNENESRIKENFMEQKHFVLINVHEGKWPPAKIFVDTRNKSFTFDEEWN